MKSDSFDFGSEQGYQSDGRVSESGSDFSAKVSDFEAGSEDDFCSETPTTVASQAVAGLKMPQMKSGVTGGFVRSETQSQLSSVSASLQISVTSEGLHRHEDNNLIRAVKVGDSSNYSEAVSPKGWEKPECN